MQLSNRLAAVAGLIRTGTRLADIGTDHGYIPIYLVQQGICDSAIAMDIGRGPLERAREHIRLYHLEHKITTRLSDGVQQLKVNEADCMVVAGMGGLLTIHILEHGREVIASMKECVLQPQSHIDRVRKYLWNNEFTIVEEDMILEDGKYYPMMRVIPNQRQEVPDELLEVYAQYGQFLVESKHPVLITFLEKEYKNNQKLLIQLKSQVSRKHERVEQLEQQARVIRQAFDLIGLKEP